MAHLTVVPCQLRNSEKVARPSWKRICLVNEQQY